MPVGPHAFEASTFNKINCSVCWCEIGHEIHSHPFARPIIGREPDVIGREFVDLHVIGTLPGAKPVRVFVNGVAFDLAVRDVKEEPSPTPFVDSIKADDPEFFRPRIRPNKFEPSVTHPIIPPAPPVTASDYHAACTGEECAECRVIAAQFDGLRHQAATDRAEAERLRSVGLKLEEHIRTLRRQKLDAENDRDRAVDDRKVAEKNAELIRDDRLQLKAELEERVRTLTGSLSVAEANTAFLRTRGRELETQLVAIRDRVYAAAGALLAVAGQWINNGELRSQDAYLRLLEIRSSLFKKEG